MTEEERIQKRCYDREDYYASLRSHEIYIAELEDKVNERDHVIAEKTTSSTKKTTSSAKRTTSSPIKLVSSQSSKLSSIGKNNC